MEDGGQRAEDKGPDKYEILISKSEILPVGWQSRKQIRIFDNL
jgi:hypothetical protein